MTQLYVIESLKWSNTANYDGTAYWGPNNSGYTTDIHKAGIYTEEQVNGDRDYYDNGRTTKAVPLKVGKINEDDLKESIRAFGRKQAAHESFMSMVKHKEVELKELKETLADNEEEIKQFRFELNQQLILHGKESLK